MKIDWYIPTVQGRPFPALEPLILNSSPTQQLASIVASLGDVIWSIVTPNLTLLKLIYLLLFIAPVRSKYVAR